MRAIELAELQAAIDHDGAIEAVAGGLRMLAAGNVTAPDELAMVLKPTGDIHIKGAFIQDTDWIVFKVATGSFPAANSGCSFLLNAATGTPTAILNDNGWLTDMRTAAAGALASNALANPGPVRVAMLGTGVQSRFQIDALRRLRTISELRVWGRTADNANQLAADLGGAACETVAEAVRDVDVVITATSAGEPFVFADVLSPGTHITAMGADTVGKNEIHPDVLSAAAVIVADDIDTCARVGELQHRPELAMSAVAFADLIAGTHPGRGASTDITVADLCGIGTHDAAIANAVASGLALLL